MKAKLLLFIFFILLAIGCENQNKKLLVLENNELDYYTDEEVDNPAIITNDQEWKKENAELLEIGKKLKSQYSKFPPKISLYFSLFINESGKVDFIKNKKRPELGNEKIVDELLQNIGEMYSKIEITPAIKEGKNIKYRKDLEIGFETVSDSLQLFIPGFIGNISELSRNIIDENDFFVTVEEMPLPIGGMKAIQEKIHYPEIAKRAGIQGRVYVKAFIDEKGNVAHAEIIKGLEAGCSEEALMAVKSTKFEPGRQRGKAVKVQVTVPIAFKLQ